MCHLWVCLQKHPSKIIPVILWNLEEKRNQPAVECLLFAMHQMHVPVPQKNPAVDLLLCPLCRSETGLKHLITRSKPGLYFISPPYHVVPMLRHALKGLETKKDRGKTTYWWNFYDSVLGVCALIYVNIYEHMLVIRDFRYEDLKY